VSNQEKRGNQDGKDQEGYEYPDQPRSPKPAAKHEFGSRRILVGSCLWHWVFPLKTPGDKTLFLFQGPIRINFRDEYFFFEMERRTARAAKPLPVINFFAAFRAFHRRTLWEAAGNTGSSHMPFSEDCQI